MTPHRASMRALAVLATSTVLFGVQPARAQNPAGPPDAAQPPSPALVAPHPLPHDAVPYPEGVDRDAVVTLTLVIGVDGAVRDAIPFERDEPFSSAAVDAARTWKFEPATRGGAPVAARIRVLVEFHAKAAAAAPAPTGGGDAAPTTPSRRRPAPPDEVENVLVRGARAEPSRTATLSRTEVREIPGAFGDPFRAIEIMPGVTPIVSGLPFFFIRGAPPGDVGYFLDGVRVPYLFHVGAGPSVVHPGIVDRVDLYPGGYPARFGRFSGGIVSGETTQRAHELHGEYNVRAFDAGALVETPFANDKGSVLLGGRYSYTAALLSLLSSDTVLDYWDAQARVTYDLTPRDRVSAFAFGAYDFLGQRTPTTTLTLFGAEFGRLDLRYDHSLGNEGDMRTAVTLGLDRTRLDQGRFLRDRIAGTRTEITYRLGEGALLRAGTDVEADAYDVVFNTADLGAAAASVVASFPSRTDLTVGGHADVVLDAGSRLQITPGARVDLFTSDGAAAVAFDPRLATRTVLDARTRLLAALGLAHQPPSFVIPVPGFQPGGLRGGLQTSVQESMGLERDLGDGTTATATIFHNGFFNMSDALSITQPTVGGCPPGAFPADTLAGDPERQPTGTRRCGEPRFLPGTIGPDRSGGGGQGAQSTNDIKNAQAFETRSRGTAYGLELFVKRTLTRRLGGFLSYTLSRSTRSANGQTFIASFDRTHVLNAALAYDLGRRWRAGTRVTFYTGLPKAADPTNPGATRLAPFYRIDLRLEKRWQLGQKSWISFVAEWLNATMTKESVGTSCTLNGCQETKVGPITIPSIGMEGGF